ncbi:F0F1 ATP synthase subunit epsilon [Polymorphobacter fuscus]|uniref:ATP synthase epsilon chain n=1 Tax=Sandarakinorhabdus fusca TaxID=1439888 RepID=A0A7C9GQP3_9SPHN|nr:F0F1 ATP synthase subunit epsilon [Polymorphobacter fuscus]KAB7646542.1 F0F1 ATP synthase subunit epsilon [Polymorphobacter fuscus]MQT17790.1 F0F1 ATP synthase subunit epsilon [Polymorphobacter fuscus]NJC09662.1 F-type H+-transporting ATPase subunit epsilon [Polymorphobacter fuscus]
MADLLTFELVSPERLLSSGKVAMVVVPGTEGDFGVLPGHAPLMSTIRPGAIAIYEADSDTLTRRIFVDGGFAEVSERGLTILAESATPVGDIDPAQVATDLAAARSAGNDKAVARLEAMQAAVVN